MHAFIPLPQHGAMEIIIGHLYPKMCQLCPHSHHPLPGNVPMEVFTSTLFVLGTTNGRY